jgi:hypothetical protein
MSDTRQEQPDNAPQTYWEKRCVINENALLALLEIVEGMAPAYMQGDVFTESPFTNLREAWGTAIGGIDAEGKGCE